MLEYCRGAKEEDEVKLTWLIHRCHRRWKDGQQRHIEHRHCYTRLLSRFVAIKLLFGNYYTLCNTSGEAICTYKFASNVSNSLGLLTAPNLGKGSISVKSGTAKPTAWDINVNDVFFINPTVITSSTAATVTAK